MTVTPAAIVVCTWWASLAFNVVAIGLALARGQVGQAGLQSLVVLGLAVGAWLRTTINQKLEAQVGAAVAERQMRELALAVMQQQLRAGNISVSVFDSQPRAPVN